MIVSLVVFALAYGALFGSGQAVLIPIAAGAAVFVFRTMMRNDRRLEPFAAVLLFAAQNVAAGVLGGAHAGANVKVAVLFSAVLPACVVLAGWSISPRRVLQWLTVEMRGTELWLFVVTIGYAALMCARWVTAPIALAETAAALRNALTPAYGILAVLLLPPELRPTVDELVSWLRRWGVLVALLGFVEIAALGDRFWTGAAHIGAAIHVKELSVARRNGATVPADFYTYFGHHYFRRLVSVYGAAITTGYYLALALLATVFGPARRGWRWVYAAVLGAAVGLSFVKGGFQIVLVGVIVALLLRTRLRWLFERGALVVMLACAVCVIGARATQLTSQQSSVQLHVSGLTSAVHEVTQHLDTSIVWGNGIGTGGAASVYIQRHAGDAVSAQMTPGLDNGAGTILVETGALGLVAIFGLFALLIPACARRARDNRAALVATAATVALLVNFLLQEHALTLVPSFPFWILATVGIGAAREAPPRYEPIVLPPSRIRGPKRVPVAGFETRATRRAKSAVH